MNYPMKPCPFCGGEAELVQKTHGYTTSPTTIMNTYLVQCSKCGIHTEQYKSSIWQGKDGTINIGANGAIDAIDAWNRREETEIIHCGECRFREIHGVDGFCDHITGEEIMVMKTDYCKWGERRTDDKN